ncbi:hypothetical protein TIFTF001_045112 [Ficus carica]|uniref:Uncharacterized protein n=1 Tax=Ficus carica TaxID=3494 RepID=A0AA87YNN3_FICCA|nr:hypothetical protein TIFTF001_045112 [Ficus carica]
MHQKSGGGNQPNTKLMLGFRGQKWHITVHIQPIETNRRAKPSRHKGKGKIGILLCSEIRRVICRGKNAGVRGGGFRRRGKAAGGRGCVDLARGGGVLIAEVGGGGCGGAVAVWAQGTGHGDSTSRGGWVGPICRLPRGVVDGSGRGGSGQFSTRGGEGVGTRCWGRGMVAWKEISGDGGGCLGKGNFRWGRDHGSGANRKNLPK